MVYLIVLLVLVATVLVVGGPLLRARPSPGSEPGSQDGALADQAQEERRVDLEAARDAKYREIRDAELDHQTGKLSDADFEAINSTLRAQALEILRELDALTGE